MDFKALNRKEFFVLTFTLLGTGIVGAAACGSSTNSNGGGGGTGGSPTCADPLPEMQVPDSTGHTHSVTVAAATLAATTDQTFTTSPAGADSHTHMITLAVANLATIKAGGTATVTSTSTDSHTHMFAVACTSA
jgi:hypothetical protein